MLVFALVSFAAHHLSVHSFVKRSCVCASARRSAYLNAKNTNTHKICRNRFDAPVALSIKHRGFFCILHFSAKRKIIYQMHMAHFSFHCILLIKHTVLRPRSVWPHFENSNYGICSGFGKKYRLTHNGAQTLCFISYRCSWSICRFNSRKKIIWYCTINDFVLTSEGMESVLVHAVGSWDIKMIQYTHTIISARLLDWECELVSHRRINH